MSEKCFIHVDLDAFYASVEQLDNPEYKGKPVIVGGLPTDRRGVVSTCSYEARAYGVHSAMPILTAVKLCPHAIFIRGRMKRYQEKSREIMNIFHDFSPDVQQISVDEAFIDISGTERLFGQPSEIAEKLKERVLEQTGLTVSVGISTTKYIAKIASGIKKPNGLYIVDKGQEESFMLQLPLKDIWGIGQKTIARIKQAGFNSSRDIHKASEGMLINLFGNATGAFLFNAVRGQVFETFNSTPKSRSISSERTFSFDLTDKYAIETALMELSWDVMFRLFTEKWTSKTAHLKIRYEDFTTVSVQETSTWPIASADDLFSRSKALFEKKYENGRGIRLIGIAAQNLEDTSLPVQQELFETTNKKKVTVEKTVIEMQKKNPGLQISKARLMKTTLAFLFAAITSLFFNSQNAFSQDIDNIELTKPFENAFVSGEAPIAIFEIAPDSPEVEFFAQGTWEAMFSNFVSITGDDENPVGLSFEAPVFVQKTDLTVWFLLQDTWYFEANVADEYDQSTVAAGYYGQGLLKHARIGNRHITFAQDYGVTDVDRGVGSGSIQSPGIMAQWDGDGWKADALLRFDMTEPLEKTWVGQNESNENILELSDWEKGARFILPATMVNNVSALYIESNDTSTVLYNDTLGITYRKLSQSEYLLVPTKNMIVLDKAYEGTILLTFKNAKADIENILGSFTPQAGFFGSIQEWFGPDIQLEKYTLGSFFQTIDGSDALVLQADNFFSPFVDASLYSVSAFSSIDTVAIVSASSGITEKSYGAALLDTNSLELPDFSTNNYFDESKNYVQVFTQPITSRIGANQFPFAQSNPLIYLTPGTLSSIAQDENDLVLSVQSLTSSPVLDIGTNVIQGSITVYRNGIKESLFRYDEGTGLVTLTNPPGTFDTIRITWRQHNESATNGSISLAAGYEKLLLPELSMNVSSSFLWPVVENDSFTDSSYDATGSINLAFDIEYQSKNLEIENTLLGSFQTADVSNTYRIDGMQSGQTQEIFLLSNAAIAMPTNLTPILNTRPNQLGGLTQLNEDSKGSSEAKTIRDSERGEYVVRTEWEIQKDNGWIAQSVNLGANAQSLPSSKEFSIWIKQPNLTADYKVFLQLGVSDDEDEVFERQYEIPTWEITSMLDVEQQFTFSNNDWQKISVLLSDEDRSKLTINQNARIIIQAPQILTEAITSVLEVGAYEVTGDTFTTSGDLLISKEVYEATTGKVAPEEMSRFNDSITNQVQYFEWDNTITTNELRASKFFSSLPFQSYKTLSFFAYVPEEITGTSSVKIVFEQESDFGNEEVFVLQVSADALNEMRNTWKEVSIDLYNENLYIGDKSIDSSDYEIKITNEYISPTKLLLQFEGSGKIYIDELHFKDSIWEFSTENIFNLTWHSDETIIGSEALPILSNASLSTNIRTGISVPLETQNKETEIGLVSDSNAAIDILGVRTEGSLVFSSSNVQTALSDQAASFNIQSASHSISSTPIFLAFEIFSFEETYRYLPHTNAAKKIEDFHFDFMPLGHDIQLQFTTEAEKENIVYSQDVKIDTSFNFETENMHYHLQANTYAQEFGYNETVQENSYASSWYDISTIQFSTGHENATSRSIGFTLNQNLNFPAMQFSPSVVLEGKNAYSNTIEIVNTASDSLHVIFPFSIGEHSFSASFSKESYTNSQRGLSTSYYSDSTYYFESLKNRTWAYTSIPLYDFYDKELRSKMQESFADNQSLDIAGYANEGKLNWQRQYSSDPLEFLIPTSASLSIARDIRASAIDISDNLQLASTVNFFSINNFGKFSTRQIFSWYEQDEFVQSFKVSYKDDYLSKDNWRIDFSGYSQASLYFTDFDRLTILAEGRIDTDNDWKLDLNTTWERKSFSSLLADGFYLIFPSLLDDRQDLTRENSVYFSIGDNESGDSSVFYQIYGIDHALTLHINAFAEIGLTIGAEAYIENSYFNIRNSLSLSGKLQF